MSGVIAVFATLISCQTENKSVLHQFISLKPKVLVCPVHVLDNQNCSYDSLSSKKIADYLNTKNYAVASLTKLIPTPSNEWFHNEAKMLTQSINYSIDFVKKSNLPDETYILYPEFYKAGPNSSICAVHYCLLNNKGEIAMRGLINSHWEAFKKVNPKNNDDCVKVFINGFDVKMASK